MLAALALLAPAALQETPLFTLPEDYSGCALESAFSPGGARAAVVIGFSDGRSALWQDGALSEPHRYVSAPAYSDDAAHVAWAWGDPKGKDREEWEIWLDGKRLKKWDWIGAMAFQPGGAELAYWAADGLRIGRDGAYRGGDYACVWGKKKADGYSDAGWQPPLWSPDGKKMAFLASKPSGTFVYVDGKSSGPLRWATALSWGCDGKEAVWAGLDDSYESVIQRGKERLGAEFDAVGAPVLGAEGALAFLAVHDDRYLVVFRGERLPGRYDDLGTPAVSPDGRRVAFAANLGRKRAQAGWSWVEPAWMDGAEVWGEKKEGGSDDGACFLVVDGQKTGSDWLRVVGPRFGPDSQRVAARVQEKDGWRVVLDDRASALYDEVSDPRFTADGAAVEFGARRGRELLRVRHPAP